MKKYILFVFLSVFSISLFAVGLVEKYKAGKVVLTSNSEFGKETNWEDFLFDSRSSMAIDKQGNVFVLDPRASIVYKFSKNGKFVKKFGKKGEAPGDLRYPGKILVAGKDKLIVDEYASLKRISVFNTNGKFVNYLKTSKANFDIVGFDNCVIAYNIKAMENEEEHIFIERLSLLDKKRLPLLDFKKKSNLISVVISDTYRGAIKSPFREIAFLRKCNGNLLVGYSTNKIINIYSTKGKLTISFDLQMQPRQVSKKLRAELIADACNSIKRPGLRHLLEKEVENTYPYYQDIVVDPEGNILVFLYRDGEGIPATEKLFFQVYDKTGKYICTSSFVSDKLKNLLYCYSWQQSQSIFFYGNSIFVLVENTDNEDEPYYEVVKFNMEKGDFSPQSTPSVQR